MWHLIRAVATFISFPYLAKSFEHSDRTSKGRQHDQAHTSNTMPSLLDLPLEVREEIYSHLLVCQKTVRESAHPKSTRVPLLTLQYTYGLFHVNKQVFAESIRYFYRHNNFVLVHLVGMRYKEYLELRRFCVSWAISKETNRIRQTCAERFLMTLRFRFEGNGSPQAVDVRRCKPCVIELDQLGIFVAFLNACSPVEGIRYTHILIDATLQLPHSRSQSHINSMKRALTEHLGALRLRILSRACQATLEGDFKLYSQIVILRSLNQVPNRETIFQQARSLGKLADQQAPEGRYKQAINVYKASNHCWEAAERMPRVFFDSQFKGHRHRVQMNLGGCRMYARIGRTRKVALGVALLVGSENANLNDQSSRSFCSKLISAVTDDFELWSFKDFWCQELIAELAYDVSDVSKKQVDEIRLSDIEHLLKLAGLLTS